LDLVLPGLFYFEGYLIFDLVIGKIIQKMLFVVSAVNDRLCDPENKDANKARPNSIAIPIAKRGWRALCGSHIVRGVQREILTEHIEKCQFLRTLSPH
jgi:hypothetical protein